MRRERPLIGVTTSEVRVAGSAKPTDQGDPARTEMVLGLSYVEAVERAGGLPVVLPPLENPAVEPLLRCLDGLLLTGGPDLDPETYGARRHPELGPTEREIDRFELSATALADARDMPLLAICRGSQALNVARGGTLVQHLPDRGESPIDHRQTLAGDRTVHPVRIATGTRLAEIMEVEHAEANSFHHQAIDQIGTGLRPVAWAPDGVIEGVEATDRAFAVGVQWHAESLVERPEHLRLFEGLVDAADRVRKGIAHEQAA
ncbi:MAG: gamma-glutamyl-gamma-aminobutyrate hydrolase family protein [Solirubrobacterales bacterium]